MIGALSAAVICYLLTHEIIRSVTILVVFCPCSLVLATPTAIMAAIGNATKHSFLVREGDALERLAEVGKITFDKTGTLTVGTPEVTAVKVLDGTSDADALYALTAAAELKSEHPLGKAIVTGCRGKELNIPECEDFRMLPGRGVSAFVNGRVILAGNTEMLEESGIALPDDAEAAAESYLAEGCTVTYIAVDGALAGLIALADTLRTDSASMIADIKAEKVIPVLLTGDNAAAAGAIARKVGIDEFRAECLPEDKLDYIGSDAANICMVGDGINDAPALKKAYVGIAMGGIGSDIAVDAADIALVDDEVKELPHLVALSKRMMTTIKLNMTFSMTLNFIAITLAIIGTLNPVVGALVHNAGSVLVITNSAFLLKWRKK